MLETGCGLYCCCGSFSLGSGFGVHLGCPQSWAQSFRAWSRAASHIIAFLFQLEGLRASYAELKAQSQEEIRRLWSQLESPRPDRQDPSGEEFHAESSDPQKLKLC